MPFFNTVLFAHKIYFLHELKNTYPKKYFNMPHFSFEAVPFYFDKDENLSLRGLLSQNKGLNRGRWHAKTNRKLFVLILTLKFLKKKDHHFRLQPPLFQNIRNFFIFCDSMVFSRSKDFFNPVIFADAFWLFYKTKTSFEGR